MSCLGKQKKKQQKTKKPQVTISIGVATGTRMGDKETKQQPFPKGIVLPDTQHTEEEEEEEYDDKLRHPSLTDDQVARKKRSIAILKQLDLPVLPSLPCIQDMSQVSLRPVREIIQRLLILYRISNYQHANSGYPVAVLRQFIAQGLAETGWFSYLTPSEHTLMSKPVTEISAEDVKHVSWTNESIWFLLYILQVIDIAEPVLPQHQCLLDSLGEDGQGMMQAKTVEQFLERARAKYPNKADRVGTVRDAAILLDISDRLYRFHWSAVHLCLQYETMSEQPLDRPAAVILQTVLPTVKNHRSIAEMWRRSLDWVLFQYAWDDVPLDT